jgi:hypothetical protein
VTPPPATTDRPPSGSPSSAPGQQHDQLKLSGIGPGAGNKPSAPHPGLPRLRRCRALWRAGPGQAPACPQRCPEGPWRPRRSRVARAPSRSDAEGALCDTRSHSTSELIGLEGWLMPMV